jgi:hypothetical protein
MYRLSEDKNQIVVVVDKTCEIGGTQFTCFTSTKVRILTPVVDKTCEIGGTQCTCFTSTRIRILTQKLLGDGTIPHPAIGNARYKSVCALKLLVYAPLHSR